MRQNEIQGPMFAKNQTNDETSFVRAAKAQRKLAVLLSTHETKLRLLYSVYSAE